MKRKSSEIDMVARRSMMIGEPIHSETTPWPSRILRMFAKDWFNVPAGGLLESKTMEATTHVCRRCGEVRPLSAYSYGCKTKGFPKVCNHCKDISKHERLECIRQKWTCSICGKGRRKLVICRHKNGMSLGVMCKKCSKIVEMSNCDAQTLRSIARRIEDR